jgi:bifunctional enzyme CysN/CysC
MHDVLKFITCGSVDDGKSTLIGHLLYATKKVYTDQIQRLELDSRIINRTTGLDYSLLLDGLSAEREQGITIDVAYRYFNTPKRSFIVADTPGHFQYTRNMAVGASFAQCAVLLVDASKGLLAQTKRHTRICALMGIKHFILAVNKMDMVGYSQDIYEKIVLDYREFASSCGLSSIIPIPCSATVGDNLTEQSHHMNWYTGCSLLEALECIDVSESSWTTTIMPIQRVNRPHATYRGVQGEIMSGHLSVGDNVTLYPSKTQTKIKSIISGFDHVISASIGQAVDICFEDDVDASRGHVIVVGEGVKVTTQFQATLLWMDDQPCEVGKIFTLKCGTQQVSASIMSIKHQLDIDSGQHLSAKTLQKNDIGVITCVTTQPLVFTPFQSFKSLGSFILIDRLTHMTSGAGVIDYDLRRARNLVPHKLSVDASARASIKHQTPMTYWFCGLSGSGKSTLANQIDQLFYTQGFHTMCLDGDNVRLGLNENLGFTVSDRHENIRRVAHVCKLMNEAGLIVFASFITPTHDDQYLVESILQEQGKLIYVSTPLEECIRRDTKGIYKKAIEESIPNFTGISAPFEAPTHPWLTIDTTNLSIEETIEVILGKMDLEKI